VAPYAVELEAARAAFLEALDGFVDTAGSLDDEALLAASRCRGWQVVDVVVHVHLGLQEMLLGLVSRVPDEPDTDAASYWTTPPPATDPGTDAVDGTRFVHRMAAAYSRPRGAVAHLRLTSEGLGRAVRSAPDAALSFQGKVLGTADFLATWVVELAVHQLDLGRELDVPDPPAASLAIARATVEALVDDRLPSSWSDRDAVLLGTGRIALDPTRREQAAALAGRLPALG
jgi:hypothetical protein